mgnify:CR=1 FL=1
MLSARKGSRFHWRLAAKGGQQPLRERLTYRTQLPCELWFIHQMRTSITSITGVFERNIRLSSHQVEYGLGLFRTQGPRAIQRPLQPLLNDCKHQGPERPLRTAYHYVRRSLDKSTDSATVAVHIIDSVGWFAIDNDRHRACDGLPSVRAAARGVDTWIIYSKSRTSVDLYGWRPGNCRANHSMWLGRTAMDIGGA